MSKTADITYTIKYVLATDPTIEVAPSVTKTVPGSTIRVKEAATKVNKEYFATQQMLLQTCLPRITIQWSISKP